MTVSGKVMPVRSAHRRARDPSVAHNSVTVAAWTLVSRTTGLVRVVVIGAVLGPTFLANTFAPTDQMPDWLRFVAEWNPISSLTQAVRVLWFDEQSDVLEIVRKEETNGKVKGKTVKVRAL